MADELTLRIKGFLPWSGGVAVADRCLLVVLVQVKQFFVAQSLVDLVVHLINTIEHDQWITIEKMS